MNGSAVGVGAPLSDVPSVHRLFIEFSTSDSILPLYIKMTLVVRVIYFYSRL